MSEQEYQCDGSATHYQGCKCHEARHAEEISSLRSECAKLRDSKNAQLADGAQLYGPERAFLLLEKQYGFGHADVAHLFGLTRQCVGQLFDGIEHRLSVMSGSVRAPKKKRKKRVLADYWKWVESGGNGHE